MLIGAYAPHEPWVMDRIWDFLKVEKMLPLGLVHKIFDRFATMSLTTTVMTYEEIQEFVKSIPDDFRIAKGPCACRINTAESLGPDARDLANGNPCICQQSPLNVDIQIATCAEKFGKLDTYEFITKDELLELEKQCHALGLVPNVFVMFGGDSGICHCSSATCVVFMANEAIGHKTTVLKKGRYIAQTDKMRCTCSGECTKVCHFHAREIIMKNGKPELKVHAKSCFGCGYCAEACPEKAITMVKRKKSQCN